MIKRICIFKTYKKNMLRQLILL